MVRERVCPDKIHVSSLLTEFLLRTKAEVVSLAVNVSSVLPLVIW